MPYQAYSVLYWSLPCWPPQDWGGIQVPRPQLLCDERLECATLLGTRLEGHCNSLHFDCPVLACQVLETAGLPKPAQHPDVANDCIADLSPMPRASAICSKRRQYPTQDSTCPCYLSKFRRCPSGLLKRRSSPRYHLQGWKAACTEAAQAFVNGICEAVSGCAVPGKGSLWEPGKQPCSCLQLPAVASMGSHVLSTHSSTCCLKLAHLTGT